MDRESQKTELRSIAEKNRIVRNIMKALEEEDGFLIIGHKNPDEDCIASMVAFGLLASKLNKKAYIAVCGVVQNQYAYLLNICTYNSIRVLDDCSDAGPGRPRALDLPGPIRVVVALDTPKPSMLDLGPELRDLLERESPLRIEIDHHLGADSSYFGDEGYRLVTTASSASELVGLLALKMEADPAFMARRELGELMTRNLVLAVVTGIIGDSRMGKYLKTKRERWFYEHFSSIFDRMLAQKTHKGSKNFTSKEEVFNAIAALSTDEEECFRIMMERKRESEGAEYVILDQDESVALRKNYGEDTVAGVAKSVADSLAEDCGSLGVVVYPDDPEVSDFVQFRVRRSQSFRSLDLRDILSRLAIANGGGHPGAIGFRFPKAEVADLQGFASDLIGKIGAMAKASTIVGS